VNATESPVLPKQLWEHGSQAGGVIALQAPAAHLAGMYLQLHQEVHGAMSYVLELALLDEAGAHRPREASTLQHLDVGLFVQAQNHLATLGQNPRTFVAPED
jgi:hypothetical protein